MRRADATAREEATVRINPNVIHASFSPCLSLADIAAEREHLGLLNTVINQSDMRLAADGLRDVAKKFGLGVAMMVAHQHGLKHGGIPIKMESDGTTPSPHQSIVIEDEHSPYVFVSVPIRGIRSNTSELIRLGIMNPNPRRSEFVYHEDGLVGAFSFDLAKMSKIVGFKVRDTDLRDILLFLEKQRVLIRANVDSMQVHFKDSAAKHFIHDKKQDVFVRGTVDLKNMLFPAKYGDKLKNYVAGALKFKVPCNYCSRELTPLELTFETSELKDRPEMRTVRNYMMGFTFAPFGDPREVMHFLAWDYPHINDVINNMDPQSYSFSDLIGLVRAMNNDMKSLCETEGIQFKPISGVCNHWAGNSIYHQHYQFFHIEDMPASKAAAKYEVTSYKGIKVERLEWELPAYRIKPGPETSGDDLMFVADKIAGIWGEDDRSEIDTSYGNGIIIQNRTQNIFVTYVEDGIVAYFIPRLRSKLNTKDPRNVVQKTNAAVLEALGYFLVDKEADLALIQGTVPNAFLSEELKETGVTEERVIEVLMQPEGCLDKERHIDKSKIDTLERALAGLRLSSEKVDAIKTKLGLVVTDEDGRKELAERWLQELSPNPEKIESFEKHLKSYLEEKQIQYEHKLQATRDLPSSEARKEGFMDIAVAIANDSSLGPEETRRLLNLVNRSYAETADREGNVLLSPGTIDEILKLRADGGS